MGRMVSHRNGVVQTTEGSVAFVLGVGAQKAGTTWLYHYLRSHPSAHMVMKEYGVLDQSMQDGGVGDGKRRLNYARRLDGLDELIAADPLSVMPDGETPVREVAHGLRTALDLMDNPHHYVEHFCALADARPGVQLVGDITPSYSHLDVDALWQVRAELERAGFSVKPVFILREPVARVVSAYDMFLRRRHGREAVVDGSPSLRKFAQYPGTISRTRYHHTVEALDEVFGPTGVFYASYETFFQDSEIKRLLSFLGVPWSDPPLDTRVNKARRAYTPSTEERLEIRSLFQEEYSFVATRFPTWDIANLWADGSPS